MLLVPILFSMSLANAAIQPIQAEFKKANRYLDKGVITGGEAKMDLVISDVRRSFSKKQSLERIVFEMESARGKSERVGYFHMAFEPQLRRIVLDLNGVAASKIAIDELSKKLEKSPYVVGASITLDPEDRSATVEIKLDGTDYKVEAFEMRKPKETGRLVLDIAKKVNAL